MEQIREELSKIASSAKRYMKDEWKAFWKGVVSRAKEVCGQRVNKRQ